ncbi:MAG: PLP-dependent aminotransferase family protein [Deinococcus sp.]|nr:PLP-dependent aminotransferase family protein [Deinococcus sp.]
MAEGLQINLDRRQGEPLYQQITRQVRAKIVAGDLSPGQRLPTERSLAQKLGVHRNTIVSAYAELEADGLITSHVGRGTFVAQRELPAERPVVWSELFAQRLRRLDEAYFRELARHSSRPGVISLAGATPAPELLPTKHFTQVLQEVLRRHGQAVLEPSTREGHGPLREWIAQDLQCRGAVVGAENVVILSGNQQGLSLLAQVLLDPGDPVLVEAPTYLGGLRVLGLAEAVLWGVPMDSGGLLVDVLQELLLRRRPKLIYTQPTFQNPTGATLGRERREHLLAAAGAAAVPVVEDDPYGALYYGAPPPPALKALDRSGRVVYLGTFSKVLAPGLRIGYLVGPEPLLHQLVLARGIQDLHSNTPAQWAAAEFCAQGYLDEHLEAVRPLYRRRRDALAEALHKYLPEGQFALPEGGFNLWLEMPEGWRALDLFRLAAERGMVFVVGESCYPSGGNERCLRLNFSAQPEEVLVEAVKRLAAAARELARHGRSKETQLNTATRPIV